MNLGRVEQIDTDTGKSKWAEIEKKWLDAYKRNEVTGAGEKSPCSRFPPLDAYASLARVLQLISRIQRRKPSGPGYLSVPICITSPLRVS